MGASINQKMILPPLRADLQFYRGPDMEDGSPTYNVFDPVRSIYFKISWLEKTILAHTGPGITLEKLHRELQEKSSLNLTMEELLQFYLQAKSQGLLELPRSSKEVGEEDERAQMNPFKWFALHYLFLRIPLVNPDRFLERTLSVARVFFSWPALIFYLFCIGYGLVIVLTRFNEFINTFPYFFNIQGVVFFALGITFTKIIHELAHAYVAKNYGLHIPTMGVAFLVLFPVLYTDATDAWRLHNKWHRLAVSAAGVIAELALAGMASIGWAYSEPGVFNSVCFVIASATWITSLGINLNPAMRFDGYYLLSDWWGIENLQQRAFAVARRESYQMLFGVELHDTEPLMSKGMRVRLTLYSFYTWAYRVVLYTVIALFVYHKFTKALGIFLFLLEILIFFVWPFVNESAIFLKVAPRMRWNQRVKILATVASLFFLWVALPLPHQQRFPAITVPVEKQILYVPAKGLIVEMHGEREKKMAKGDLLLALASPDSEKERLQLQLERKELELQLSLIQEQEEAIPLYLETEQKLARVSAQLSALEREQDKQKVHAEFDGRLIRWDEDLQQGQYLAKNSVVGILASREGIDVMAFLPEKALTGLKEGDPVTFRARDFTRYSGRIVQISPGRAHVLSYPALGSIYGGSLPVTQDREDPEKLMMVESYFPILVHLETGEGLKYGATGELLYTGTWYSLFWRGIQRVAAVVVRESGGF